VRFVAAIFCIAAFAGLASAQTTRESSPIPGDVPLGWQKQITSLAAAIAAKDTQALQDLTSSDCQIRKFNADRDGDLSDLTDFATSVAVLGDHAYTFPALTAASDIADDVNSSTIITAFTKHSLDLDPKRDQTTVLQWITSTLNTRDGALIGLIVLWDPRPDIEDRHRPNFILVLGERAGDDYKLKRLTFGDPLE
jgi:hypothetical protein